MRLRPLLILFVLVLTFAVVSQSLAAGRYCLAYWRELGSYENSLNHSMFFRVWDEQGNPKPGVQIYTTWNVLLGTTDTDGRCEVVVDVNNDHYECKCVDTAGSTSDYTPWMTSRRWPDWGHYSYEIGFMYKSSESNPGTYDTSLCGTVNLADSNETDAPCTKSLAYYSTNCQNRMSDAYTLTSWKDSHGQTFVANGDRVTGVAVHGAIGDNYSLSWTAEILDGGPTGARVAGPKSIPVRQPIQWFLPFGVNEAPVIPGHTYYLKITRSGGLNIWTTGNNYINGTYYLDGAADATKDIQGLVLCMNYGSSQFGTLQGTVTSGGAGLADAIVTVTPGNYAEYTQPDGTYTFTNLQAGTYTVSVWKPGYTRSTQSGKVVTTNQTTTADFSLNALANIVTNPGFETGDTSGWTAFGSGFNSFSGFAVPAHTGGKFGGYITSGGSGAGGVYQVLTVTPGVEYTTSSYAWTDSWDGTARDQEFPNNCRVRVGVDPNAGVNPDAAGVVWSDWTTSFIRWSPVWVKLIPTNSQMTLFLQYVQDVGHTWNKCCFDDVYVTREIALPDIHITAGPSASAISANSATVNWTTDAASDSRVDYGTTAAYGQNQYNASAVTGHSLTLTGLTPGTTYHCKVTSSASGYNTASSGDFTFTTNSAPQITFTSGPTASVTHNSATITWATDVASTSRVDYGTTSSYGQNQANPSLLNSHSITLSGLSPGITYHYKATSTATGYADAVSGDLTFTTYMTPGLLQNPGFESQDAYWTKYGQFDEGGDNGIQSAGWFQGFNPRTGLYFAGSVANWGYKNGGFYQKVGSTPGQLYKFTSYIRTYHGGVGTNDDTTNRVGIDPTGGTDPASPNVIWSSRKWADMWTNIGTAAVAQGPAMTVFIDAYQGLASEWNLNAFDDTALASIPIKSIPQAKQTADGVEVGILGRVVTAGTAEMGGAFYIEEDDRSSAMRVQTTDSVAVGQRVDVTGVLGTTGGGERFLTATTVRTVDGGSIGPLGTRPGLLNAPSQAPDLALLVRTWGVVSAAEPGYITVSDGSSQVRVNTGNLTTVPGIGQYAAITGICLTENVGGTWQTVVKLRSQADVSTF